MLELSSSVLRKGGDLGIGGGGGLIEKGEFFSLRVSVLPNE